MWRSPLSLEGLDWQGPTGDEANTRRPWSHLEALPLSKSWRGCAPGDRIPKGNRTKSQGSDLFAAQLRTLDSGLTPYGGRGMLESCHFFVLLSWGGAHSTQRTQTASGTQVSPANRTVAITGTLASYSFKALATTCLYFPTSESSDSSILI